MRDLPGLRGLLALGVLLILAAVELASFPFRALPRELREMPGSFSIRTPAHLDAAVFWFDPGYAEFLEAVRDRTPENATVAIVAPAGELYVYRAVYELVPRRIVGASEIGQARFVAAYRAMAAPGLPPGTPISSGTLFSR